MSRGQQGEVFNTSQQENKTYNQNAQDAFSKSQADVGDFGNQLAKFSAANPYGEGGQFQKSENQILANTSDAAAKAAGQVVQGEAVRTGENSGSAIAATEAMQQQNERALSGQQAGANADRIAAGADYGKAVLAGHGAQEQMQDVLAQQQGAAAQGALGTQEQAAEQPSFMDTLGSSFAGALGKAAGSAVLGPLAAGCWIAAELWGGWIDPRTILVRLWLWTEFRKRPYGPAVLWAYKKWGEQVAISLRTRPRRRAFFQWLFDGALERAEAWHDKEMRRVNFWAVWLKTLGKTAEAGDGR